MARGRGPIVVKLGGSHAFATHLRAWLDALAQAGGNVVVVPGGGPFADAVRTVGYANAIKLTPPEGVTVEVPDAKDPTTIVVKGADKQKVGQFAAEIRAARKPEPYKGKGIRYHDEVIRRKEGKSFASGG